MEPPPEDGARTKLFDRKIQFRESHTEAETEKTPDRIPEEKNDHIYIYGLMFRDVFHLELLERRRHTVPRDMIGGIFFAKLLSTYCVNPSERYSRMSPQSWGVAQS